MSLRIAAITLALIAAFASGAKVEHDRQMKRINAEKLQAEHQVENNRLLAQSSINKIDAPRAAKAAKARSAVQSNLAKVGQYAPTTFPPLPGAFRLWHDAAATGEEAADPSGIDAASVSLRETAVSVAANYASANYDKQRLEALQAIVKASGCFDVEE